MARHSRLCAVAALAIVALSGCGARPNAAGDTSTRLTVTTTTESAPSPPPTTEGTAPQGEGVPCTAETLSGTVEPQNSSAGNRAAILVVRNKSQQTCTLQGYGGLDLLDVAKNVLATQAERNLDPAPALVSLRPGAEAGKILHWGVVAADDEPADEPCQPPASGINVIPPDETVPFAVEFEFGPVCDHGRIETSAYFAR